MALPTFVSVGALSASVGAITPTMAASVLAGDILLFPLHTNSGEAITVSGGTETWAEVTDSPQDGTNFRLTLFWARASQDAPTSPTTSDSGNHNIGAIAAFRGCIATGNPWDVTSAGVDNVSDTALSITGDTTTVADCLVVQLVGLGTSKTVSGEANTDLANLTERFEASSGAGNGGSLAVYTGEKASAGAFGATTATISTASRKAFITVALKPPAGGVTGTGAFAAAAASLAGTGTETITGTGALAAPAAALAGTGTETITGTGAVGAAAAALSGSGTSAEAVTGTGAFAAAAASFAGVGTHTEPGVPASGGVAYDISPLVPLQLPTVGGSGALAAAPAAFGGQGDVGPDPILAQDDELLLLLLTP